MHDILAPRRSASLVALFGWLALAFAAAAVGSIASANAASFYRQLVLPGWAPPAWLFAPVWSALYLLMGVSAWLVWRERGLHGARSTRVALTLFVAQLVVNALWSWLFFAWQRGALAMLDIIILWGLIVAMVVAFWRISPRAGALQLPYLAWVSFASALTWACWQQNPQLLG
ncbi:TspO/MBR family protein [Uliginosibacterium sp. H3]|uniref:TspO/MBR family protein n=1 Tax=Uliginosibacterium silvisoli TaxID=3114758 RepID=A0ABU6JYC6_9RHOO|nr:TspO/MBR family protein [Uliginosibacterium sp. H3]